MSHSYLTSTSIVFLNFSVKSTSISSDRERELEVLFAEMYPAIIGGSGLRPSGEHVLSGLTEPRVVFVVGERGILKDQVLGKTWETFPGSNGGVTRGVALIAEDIFREKQPDLQEEEVNWLLTRAVGETLLLGKSAVVDLPLRDPELCAEFLQTFNQRSYLSRLSIVVPAPEHVRYEKYASYRDAWAKSAGTSDAAVEFNPPRFTDAGRLNSIVLDALVKGVEKIQLVDHQAKSIDTWYGTMIGIQPEKIGLDKVLETIAERQMRELPDREKAELCLQWKVLRQSLDRDDVLDEVRRGVKANEAESSKRVGYSPAARTILGQLSKGEALQTSQDLAQRLLRENYNGSMVVKLKMEGVEDAAVEAAPERGRVLVRTSHHVGILIGRNKAVVYELDALERRGVRVPPIGQELSPSLISSESGLARNSPQR